MNNRNKQSYRRCFYWMEVILSVFLLNKKTISPISIIGFLICILMAPAYGQRENVWMFGDGAGLDFNSGKPVAIESKMRGAYEASASICDVNGRLLFYTEGSIVWNRNDQIMPNGQPLTDIGSSATQSSSQGALIVPMPGNDLKYYIFSMVSTEFGSNLGRLYYSIVDMSLDGGKGDVVASKKGILLDTYLTEHLTSIVGDRCNIWVVVAARGQSRLKAFQVTDAGVDTVPVISNFDTDNTNMTSVGWMDVAPNRKKMAIGRIGSLELYDFNPASGVFSNRMILSKKFNYGVCFSPDNSKLYGSGSGLEAGNDLAQYDLSLGSEAAIIASKTVVGSPGSDALKRGPDGKIYFGRGLGIGCIDFPNLPGLACQYKAESVALISGTNPGMGLPNNVSILVRDTLLTEQVVKAGCFADINPLLLQAKDPAMGWDYLWSNGTQGTSNSVNTPGSYWVSYHTPPCIFHVDTFHVQFPNGVLPKLNINPACRNAASGKAFAYTYLNDTVTYHYTWRNTMGNILSTTDTLQRVGAGKYTLQVSTINCDTILSFYIPENDYKVSFVVDTLACENRELQLENTSDPHFTTFSWNFGDQNSSLLDVPAHIYTHTGHYEIRLIGSGKSCTDTAYRKIIVDAPVRNFGFVTSKDSICSGQALIFTPETDSTTINLEWNFGDGNSITTDNNKVQHAFETSGVMAIQLNGHFRACPELLARDTLCVFPLPMVHLSPNSTLCLNDKPLILTNHATNAPGAYQYQWSTGESAITINIRHPGAYSLTLTNTQGCSTTESVLVRKDCYTDIPNAFTPNGDGANDYFFPRQLLSKGVTNFSMQVVNRWGQVVFETHNTDGRGWDGRFNAKEEPVGVYVYRIVAKLGDRDADHYEGTITLLR